MSEAIKETKESKKAGRKVLFKDKRKITVDLEDNIVQKIDYLKEAYMFESRGQVVTMGIEAYYNAYLRKIGQV